MLKMDTGGTNHISMCPYLFGSSRLVRILVSTTLCKLKFTKPLLFKLLLLYSVSLVTQLAHIMPILS
jgi:hypothetical protein